MLNLIKPLFKRFDIDWNNISIFAKVRLIWFGPPTLICWMSAPVFFVIALITWSGKYAEDGGMAVLLGYIGLFLSGILEICVGVFISMTVASSGYFSIMSLCVILLKYHSICTRILS